MGGCVGDRDKGGYKEFVRGPPLGVVGLVERELSTRTLRREQKADRRPHPHEKAGTDVQNQFRRQIVRLKEG